MHFGTLRALCHEKHSELPLHLRKYKGRVVFRGDIVKDEDGWYAVFSEQGTSSSHMAATNFMDVLARCPGNDGEDSDAVAAYNQVRIDEDLTYLLGKGAKFVDTWVTLPRNRWPEEWTKNGAHWDEPVVRVKRNIYGHKLAALLWQKYVEWIITTKCGFEKLVDWECLYVHRKKKLFLSIYVDDLKMAGCQANIAPMWEELKKYLGLDPPSRMTENQYLGSSQRDFVPDPVNVEKMGAAFENFSIKTGEAAARVAHPELRKDGRAPDGLDQANSEEVDLDKVKDGVDGKTSAGNPKPRYDPTKRKGDRKGQTFQKKEIKGTPTT